jgi:hypothetical protein
MDHLLWHTVYAVMPQNVYFIVLYLAAPRHPLYIPAADPIRLGGKGWMRLTWHTRYAAVGDTESIRNGARAGGRDSR